MSSISAVGGNANWAAQVSQAAAPPPKRVDRDGDHDNNKPDTAAETAKDAGVTPSRLNIKA